MGIIRGLFKSIFPPLCPVCDEVFDECRCYERGYMLCEPFCSVCAMPFNSNIKGEWKCGKCIKEKRHFKKTIAVYKYNDRVKDFIHNLKYNSYFAGLKAVSRILANKIATYGIKGDLIVPVPLAKNRLKERGFNQSSLIAGVLSHFLGIPVDYDLLFRKKPTPPLFSLKPGERKKVINGAFEVSHSLYNKRIILVDDVMTTGVTANECSKVLLKNGADEVYVAVIARSEL